MKRDVQFVKAIDVRYDVVRDAMRDRACWLLCGSEDDPALSCAGRLPTNQGWRRRSPNWQTGFAVPCSPIP